MTAVENFEAQRLKEKAIRAARKALRDCQKDRDSFLLRYPSHADAKRLYEAQVKALTADLERLVRGK